ncbi:MAG: RNA-processing protein [Staphylothermus sp.]|nr:RNA-processing protein [Staphylothermus sp.]
MSEEQKGKLTMGVTRLYEKVPLDRIGVLIGHEGKIKDELMRRTRTIITVDSTTGTVIIEPATPNTTALELMKARDVVRAIAYGFSPERAFRLLDEDQVLLVIDLKQYVGDKPNHLQRVKGRIIGESGKTRRIIEEMTGTYISIYKHYVAIIGDFESANIAKNAIELLIEGRRHGTVYRYIERETFLEKRRKMRQLWKEKI